MPTRFNNVYVTSTGSFLPGAPVGNDDIDQFIAPINATSARIKRRILAENGIATRHYAIDADGATLHSNAQMAAMAIGSCLADAEVTLQDVTVLCTGSSGGDLAVPGFANMVQGELHAPPMLTSSHQGVCAAGMAALQHAASALELSGAGHALVAARCRRACSSALDLLREAMRAISTRTSSAGCCPTARVHVCSAGSLARPACL
jgi:3-oxoacyl-[acyl-carrier-protein] synthase III